MNILLAFITQTYFAIAKEVRLNSAHYLIMKIPNKKDLQNIATDHSADIDCKDFMKIYKKCTSESYSFLNIYTISHADNSLRFRNNTLIKMTLTDEFKILNDKIEANQAQCDLDGEAAKIFPLSPKELDKCEYLTG